MECDALGHGIGVVIVQEGKPLSVENWKLKGKNLLKTIYENEMLAILHEIKKGFPYLIGRHFKVITNHDSVKYFLEKISSSKEQWKWVTKKLGYEFKIIFKKGKQNVVVDALSRKEDEIEGLLGAISIILIDWVEE